MKVCLSMVTQKVNDLVTLKIEYFVAYENILEEVSTLRIVCLKIKITFDFEIYPHSP